MLVVVWVRAHDVGPIETLNEKIKVSDRVEITKVVLMPVLRRPQGEAGRGRI
jgi:hypothetical protein